MHSHPRSNRNFDRNQAFIDILTEELSRPLVDLGFRPVITFQDHEFNLKTVADQLRRVADEVIGILPKEDPWLSGESAPSVRDQLWPVSNRIDGRNPITVCEAQWVSNDLFPAGIEGLDAFTSWVKKELVPRGASGYETVAWRYDLMKLLGDDSYRDQVMAIHAKVPRVDVFSNHLIEQAVCDPIRATHAGILPPEVFGTDNCPYAVNFRAGVMAMAAPVISKRLKLNDVVHGFCGGAGLWQVVYDFVRNQTDINLGLTFLTGCWNPILDVYAHLRCVHGLEVHGTEAAFDGDSFALSLQAFSNRPEWGLGYDRSHLIWQRLCHLLAMRRFADRIYHLHFKSVRFDNTGATGIMRGLQPLGQRSQGWQFHTVGNGHDRFGNSENLSEDFIAINNIAYHGNVSIENEEPDSDPQERMAAAVTNTVAANFKPGKLHLPDAT